MNTRHHLITLLSGLAALALVGCAPKKTEPTPAMPSTPATPSTSSRDTLNRAADTASNTMNRAGDALATSWANIKDATYDERTQFQASLRDLTTTVDARINEMQAKSANATDATKDKMDGKLADLKKARENLKEEIADLGKATAATWNDAKAQVANAWERVREAYTKIES